MKSLAKHYKRLNFGSVIGGSFLLIALTLAGIPTLGQLIPIVLMVGLYIILLIKNSSEFLDLDDIDSYYYTGFIFTIAFLIASLTPLAFVDVGVSKPLDPSFILKTFGLGLFTTLLGLVGRITLLQIRRAPEEATESAIARLNTSAVRLSENVSSMALQIRESTEELSGGLKQLSGSTVSAAKSTEDYLTKIAMASEQLGSLSEASKQFRMQIEGAATGLERSAAQLTSSVAVFRTVTDHVAEGGVDLARSLSQLSTSVTTGRDVVNSAVTDIGGAVKQLSIHMRTLSDAAERLLPTSIASFSDFVGSVSGANVEVGAFAKSLQTVHSSLSTVEPALGSMSGRIGDFNHNLENTIVLISDSGVGKQVAILAKDLGDLSENSKEATVAMGQVSLTARESGNVMGSLVKQTQLLVKELASIQVNLAALVEANNAPIKSLKSAAETLSKINADLSGMSGSVGDFNEAIEKAITLIGIEGVGREFAALTQQAQSLSDGLSKLKADIALLQIPKWDLAENLKRSQEAVLRVHTSLAQLTDDLVRKLS